MPAVPPDPSEPSVRFSLSDLPRIDTDVTSLCSFGSYSRPVTAQSMTPFSHAPSYSWPQPHNAHHHHHHHNAYAAPVPTTSSSAHPAPYATTQSKFQTADEDIEEFEEFLRVRENPLDVHDDDGGKKRYKAYRQWLRGKSFFKQSKVDPEWQNQLPVR